MCATASSPRPASSTLSDEDAKARGRDYLQEEIASRDSAAFRMIAVIAEDGDAVDDPTIAWPEEREKVELGRLELTGLETERERDGDILVFDPTRVTDGIEPQRRRDPPLPPARVLGLGNAPLRRPRAGLRRRPRPAAGAALSSSQ